MKHRRLLFSLGLIMIVIGSLLLLRSLRPGKLGPARSTADIDSFFTRIDKPRGWIGGDGGASIKLPDGRILFVWADSFIGSVKPDGSYAPFQTFVRNSLTTMKPDGSDFTTFVKGTTGKESAFIPNVPDRPGNHLWPYSGMVVGDKVILLANEWQPDNSADFGSAFTGNTWVVTLSLPTLAVESSQQIIANDDIQWGSTIFNDGDYTYVYGQLDGKTYVYRNPRGQLTQAPQYRTKDGWSDNRAHIGSISNYALEAITKIDGQYHALFMKQPFPKSVSEASASDLAGPWKQVANDVYKIPEAKNNKLLEYMPRIHESLSQNGEYVMSYSVNAYKIRDIPGNARYYQPAFFRGPVK